MNLKEAAAACSFQAEPVNPPTLNEKCLNVHPTTHQPQPQYDNKMSLLKASESPYLGHNRLVFLNIVLIAKAGLNALIRYSGRKSTVSKAEPAHQKLVTR